MARILLIDDEGELRALLKEALVEAGHEVLDAADGDAGLRLYRANPTDVVITDILMPHKVGLVTILELKRDFPKARIIAMSGGFNQRTDQDSILAGTIGVHRTLAKPFSPQRLVELVNEVLTQPIPSGTASASGPA